MNAWRDQYVGSMNGSIDSMASNHIGACFRDDANRVLAGPIEICENIQQGMPDWDGNDITQYQILNNNMYNTVGNVSQLELTQNIITWENWGAGVGSGAALLDEQTQSILFSYGQDIVAQTFAINQALALSGVQIDGYAYGWTYRLVAKEGYPNDMHTDTLIFDVEVKDANGNVVEKFTYDRSGTVQLGINDEWKTEKGLQLFLGSVINGSELNFSIQGSDGGYWAGYYGPQVRDVMLNLIYRNDPCTSDPTYDTSCSGYNEAMAQQEYDRQCVANPTYDMGCPGYEQAYKDQQCSAYPLYDASCAGYDQAYLDQQCSYDPLYDTSCSGYDQAYLDQQCKADSLYDTSCSGYEEAYFDMYVKPGLDATAEKASGTSTDVTESFTSVPDVTESFTDPVARLTDPTANLISPTPSFTIDATPSAANPVGALSMGAPIEQPSAPAPEQRREAPVEQTNSSTDVEKPVDSGGNKADPVPQSASTNGSRPSSSGTNQPTASTSETPSKSDPKANPSQEAKAAAQKAKVRELMVEQGKKLGETISNAVSLDAQKAVQNQMLSAIGFNPDFTSYAGSLGDSLGYVDVGMADSVMPKAPIGSLRNGLAQQILHEKMVESQYK